MLIAALSAAVLIAALLSLLVGPAPLSAGDVFAALLGRGADTAQIIVWDLRLPRDRAGADDRRDHGHVRRDAPGTGAQSAGVA